MKDPEREIHRDPEKEQAILRAALREFAGRGYRAADVQAVADRAGVGKGTVYRYFTNKEGLLRAVAAVGLARLEQHFLELLGQDLPFLDLIRRMVIAYAEVFQADPAYVDIMLLERTVLRGDAPDTHGIYRERNRERIEGLIRGAIADGTLRPLDPALLLRAMGDALYGTVLRGVMEGRSEQLARDAEHQLDLFLEGIRA